MPLLIKGTKYVAPGEHGTAGPTGEEIMQIEDHFGLDGLKIFETLINPDKERPGYTIAKAMYATAWICRTRAGEIVSIADVLKDTSVDQIEDLGYEAADDPKEPTTEVATEI